MNRVLQISLLIYIFAVLLAACAPAADQTHPPAQVAVGAPFEIREGKVISVGNGDFLVTVLAFGEDSRCPMNAICLVAGQAALRLGVNGEEVELTVGANAGSSTKPLEGGFTLELLEINPFPGSPEEAAGDMQSARLVIKKN